MSAIGKATVFLAATCILAQPDGRILVQTSSVRPHTGPLGQAAWPHILISGNRISATAKLSVLIMLAYELSGDQIAPGPVSTLFWDGEYFDVTATSGGATPGLAQARQMLRQILADHFQLKTHWEAEEFPVFELKVAQSGPRLRESTPDAMPFGSAVQKGPVTRVSETKRSMAQLALLLTSFVGQPVLDKTGLNGTYDFTLDLKIPEPGQHDDPEASMGTALEQQLGLTLAPSKSRTEKLIVDHAERPKD